MTPEQDAQVIDAMARLGELMDFVAASWCTSQVRGPIHIAIMRDPLKAGSGIFPGALGGMVNNSTICNDMPEGPEYSNFEMVALSHNENAPRITCLACIKALLDE